MSPQQFPAETVEGFEMQLRSLLGLLDQAVFLVDQHGVILEASPQTEKLLAASPAQLVQTSVELLIHPDDRPRWREKLEMLRERDRVRDSFRLLSRERAPVDVDAVIGTAGEGRMMVVLRDVSDHYSREQELQRRNREATALFELGRLIGSSLDTGQLLDSVVKNTLWILECQFAGIVIVDAGGGGLSWSAISGSRTRKRGEAAKPEIRQLSGIVMRDRKPVALYRGDAGSTGSADASQFLEAEELNAMCAIPLAQKESRLGMLISGYRLEHRFSEDELRFLSSLSDTATLALENARLYQDSLDSAAQLKSLSSRLSSVQEEERGRISRELHDGIGQALTAIRLNFDLLSREAAVADPGMQGKFRSIYHLIDETLEEIRTMAFDLRPTVLDNVGLAGALKIYVERFSRQTEIPVRLECPDDLGRCDSKVEATVFRVVQESLTNIAKHAGASEANVEVVEGEGELSLDVSDDGCGLNPRKQAGFAPVSEGLGILNMRERIAEVSGEFEITSTEGKGTRIHARIPCR